ncbi:efflux pump antibiotic resistance protein [Purpureocillium lavendulum]|uniref:Efflux pump antibiotic resistance protein n=1 Tax=Purpureocillium lavendulum TaxID=1247861 RepID=A0AB34G002_9HYPO|nr:efflux pump antibiotic resistance protein [Purpureocillium lavendulum]
MTLHQAKTSSEDKAEKASLSSVSTPKDTVKAAPAGEQDDEACEPDLEKPQQSKPPFQDEAEKNYKPKTAKFWLIMLSAFVAMFLVALDRTILSTAIPRITDDFGSLGDIGWYGAAYMLTTAAFQLVFGRIYRFYNLRWTFLVCIIIFEVGSALCGAAPNSPVFIVGRSIAGLGSAGIMTGSMLIIIPMVPLHKRPMFQSMFGLVFGISSVAGPLIGGAFTEHATWRWCFYMNLPIGAAAFVFLFFFLDTASKPQEPATTQEKVMRLDPLGTFFFVPSTVCLILALQWGGSAYPWSNWRIILLFVMFGILAVAFAAVQITMPNNATLPVRIIMQRSILAGTLFMLFLAGGMIFLWPPADTLSVQTTHGIDPVKSGIYTIPLVLSLVVAGILSAAFTQRIGYYVPSMIICSCVTAIGQGLMTTFTPSTGSSHWIAYQFLTGFGVGLGMQTVGLAVQATLPKEDIPSGLAVTFFAQQLGGAIFVSVGQTILSGLLVSQLSHLPGLDPEMIVKTGATELRHVVPQQYFDTVVDAYNYACTRIFFSGVALAVAQLVCALCMEWRSIKKNKQSPPLEDPGEE